MLRWQLILNHADEEMACARVFALLCDQRYFVCTFSPLQRTAGRWADLWWSPGWYVRRIHSNYGGANLFSTKQRLADSWMTPRQLSRSKYISGINSHLRETRGRNLRAIAHWVLDQAIGTSVLAGAVGNVHDQLIVFPLHVGSAGRCALSQPANGSRLAIRLHSAQRRR